MGELGARSVVGSSDARELVGDVIVGVVVFVAVVVVGLLLVGVL